MLEKHKARAIFLIAPAWCPLNNEFDPKMKTFTHRQFNWKMIKQNCREFHIFHSDNDPYIPLGKAKELAEKLGIKVNLIKKAGHFNEKAGYLTFPELLEKINYLS